MSKKVTTEDAEVTTPFKVDNSDGSNLTGNARKISELLDSIKELLIYKNRNYGDSALKPINIFSKLDTPTTSILIRLDDKLNRIKNNNGVLRINDVSDIIGYCTLLLIDMGATPDDIVKLKD